MMEKKASDMHLKILSNRIERLDSAEKNAKRKLKLAQKRALQIQQVKRLKEEDSEKQQYFKNQKRETLLKKREEVLSMRKNIKMNIIMNKNKNINYKRDLKEKVKTIIHEGLKLRNYSNSREHTRKEMLKIS